jgi:hypothetical protein
MGDLQVTDLDAPPDDFLPDEPEGATFHKAFQASAISEFTCRYLLIEKQGKRIAIVPYFTGVFSLGTLLPEGWLKKCISWIKLRYACVGHPSTDFGLIDGEISSEVLALVNTTLEKKSALLAYKDFPENLPLTGFTQVRGLPVAVLKLKDDYYSTLDGRRRYDFRHKLSSASSLRFAEYGTLPEQLLAPVYQLYLNTVAQASLRFETLTPEYFRAVAGVGKFHLYFEGERLIGFLQILFKGNKSSIKYIGMDYQRNRKYNLYFVMCLRAIEASLQSGCTESELGVSSYQAKHLMGCEMVPTCIYYRHRNALANRVASKFKFLLEPAEQDLR